MSPPERQAKLGVFIDVLQHLACQGLTAAAVIANFHRQRMLPLMERRLAIYQLMPQAASEGSWMVAELLTHDVATQRAKRTVSQFPSNYGELWAIKMRPESGYIQMVRIAFNCRRFALFPISPPNLCRVRRGLPRTAMSQTPHFSRPAP